jgi:hypothetical protein
MRLLKYAKDGGAESTVSGFYFVEIKSLFTIVLLRFQGKSREAFHTHAFNAISWVLKGKLTENHLNGYDEGFFDEYTPSLKPIITPRSQFHKVDSDGDTWALSFRGPWVNTWREYLPALNKFRTLTNGRKVVA